MCARPALITPAVLSASCTWSGRPAIASTFKIARADSPMNELARCTSASIDRPSSDVS
jgi:hypothetical protein